MIVTGDYHHTAIAVAKGVGMIPSEKPVVIIQCQADLRTPSRYPGATSSALKSSKPASQSPHAQSRAVSFHICKDRTSEGLRFLLDNGDPFEDGDTLKALTSLAQV